MVENITAYEWMQDRYVGVHFPDNSERSIIIVIFLSTTEPDSAMMMAAVWIRTNFVELLLNAA